MDTNALKKFAQSARNLLIGQVTARLDMVLAEGAAARREHPKAIAKLEAAANSNRVQVIEQAAYTWFNRFTALRFMDVTGLTNPRVVSPQTAPPGLKFWPRRWQATCRIAPAPRLPNI